MTYERKTGGGSAAGVSDHGALTGLGDDDHAAVYSTLGHAHSGTYVPRTADAKVYRSATYSIPNAVVTAIPWDAEEYDNGGFHDNATNNTRLTVPTGQGGLYDVGFCFGTDASGTSRFFAAVRKNGTTTVRGSRSEMVPAGGFPFIVVAFPVELAATDYVEVMGYQDVGTTRNMDLGASAFWLRRAA